MYRTSFHRLTAVFSAFVFFAFSFSAQGASALWIAESKGAIKVAGDSGEILFEIPQAGGVDGIAVDNDGGRVWTLGGRRLKAYDTDGTVDVDVAVPPIHKHAESIDMLADAGGVWLAARHELFRFDAQGRLQNRVPFRFSINSMALDTERGYLWVAVPGHVFIVDQDGNDIDRFRTHFPLITQLDYDANLDSVWLVAGPYLLRLNAGNRDLAFVSRFGVGFKLWRHLSADGQGGVWGADPIRLSHVNAAGEVEFTFQPFQGYHGKQKLQDLAASPEDGSVWLANETTIRQYSIVGAQEKELTPDLGDGIIRSINRMVLSAQTQPPELSIAFPVADSIINTNTPTIELHYSSDGTIDTGSVAIKHNDTVLTADCIATQTEASCPLSAALPNGEITLTVTVADTSGNISEPSQVMFTVDTVAPVITITNPADGIMTNIARLTISGTLDESAPTLTLNHNGELTTLRTDSGNAFSHALTLAEGGNAITVTAVDSAGNSGSDHITVTLDTIMPVIPDLGLIHIGQPDESGIVTVTGQTDSVEPGSRVRITNRRTGDSILVTADANGAFTASIGGVIGDDIRITVTDAAGNTSEHVEARIQPDNDLPPDLSVEAPPLNPTGMTPLADATAFLYTGGNPIQTGVQPGTIEAKRVAVIRGKVLDKQNHPLPGVTVTVKDHPELGQTLSRDNGLFDLVVNGGGILTLNYEKAGYLQVQRQVNAPWQAYAIVDSIVMIPLDPQVTTIDLNNPTIQVAQGTPQIDEDGMRQATVLFPPGTTATMILPNGTQQALTTLNIRATEYTVGKNGPKTMPAELPPASGYTYAVELSVDEALAANATRVNFSQPVPFYVDNFLDFPIGEAVPTGYYDREQAIWIPSDNGRIVEILDIENNLAILDVEGGGDPADVDQLAELGVTDAERQQLATLYPVGKSLWRVPIPHFTPWDHNWPYGPPENAVLPPKEPPEIPDSDRPKNSDDENECDGCIISPQAQTVGEEIPIAGTLYSLHYRSDRVLGRKTKDTMTIPVSGASVPGSLRTIRLSVQIAGQQVTREFAPQPNLKYTFSWDGLDGFGRPVHGSMPAIVNLVYTYECEYRPGDNGFARFTGSVEAIGTRENCEAFLLPQRWEVLLESPFKFSTGVIGHWSLNIHHVWDARQSRLILGNGENRGTNGTISTVVGTGIPGFSGNGGPADEAQIRNPADVEVDSVGNLYIADMANHQIRKVSPNGVITTIAGSQSPGRNRLNSPQGVAVDAAGVVYIADTNNHRIRRVAPNGSITVVAGTGTPGFSGDGGLAIEAQLNLPRALAVDAAGNLYIGDTNNFRIRQVDPGGTITTVAGSGSPGDSGDGFPAVQAQLNQISDLAVDSSGNLYVADLRNHSIRRIGRDGFIDTIAGGGDGDPNPPSDGTPAIEADLAGPNGLVFDDLGNLYVSELFNRRISRISAEGVITTVAGLGEADIVGDDGPPIRAYLESPKGLAVDAAGNLFVADFGDHRIRRIARSALYGSAVTAIVSEDGRQQFVFDDSGRHLRTLDTFTRAIDYEFGRDEQGRLIAITDVDGDVTTIERDANGNALAIVSPDGQRTEFTLNANGYLETATSPEGETWRMAYTADGLMTTFHDSRDQANTFQYDSFGRLTQDINAGLGGWALDRIERDRGYQVTMSTAEGRQLSFTVEPQANGDWLKVNTLRDGSVQTKLFKANGEEITTQPDGTVMTLQEGPDPRFGMQAPVPERLTLQTPGRLTSTTTATRTASPSDSGDPLSLESLTETVTVNGHAFRSVYDATAKMFTFTSPEGRTSIQAINKQGRPVSTQITGLVPIDFGYDVRGRLEQIVADDGVEQRLTQLDYYSSGPQAGFLQSITDAENRTVRFEYDNVGRVTKQILPDSREIQYGYNANGSVTSITPPGRPAHIFNYNAFDLEDQYTPPDVSGIENPATIYDYNLDKELIRITRPDGQTVNFNYNDKAQLTSMAIPRGGYTYAYNVTTGQVDSITAPGGGTLTYDYDGFLPIGQIWAGDISGSVTQRYNNNFLVSQRCVNSDCVSFGYDNDNMLTSAGSLSVTHDPQRAGLVTGTTQGSVTTSQGYNTFGELTSFDAKYLDTQYFHTQYVRDRLGRITQKTETIDGVTTTEIYGYDQAGRLETVNRNGILTTYAYDSNGNRLSKTTGTEVESGAYDDQDRLLSYTGCNYTYTDNGELKTKTCGSEVTPYEYDVLGNLISVNLPDSTHIEYIIDGQNRRIGKKVNDTLMQGFLYADQLNPIAELNADGTIRSRFVYGDKINVPTFMIRDGATYRIISDHLGSPRLIINTADGSIVQRMDYDEFGNVILDTNPGLQPFGFSGGIYDSDTGLVRFGARDYSAGTGRWTSKDPITFNGGLNLYGYSLNDPINSIDFNGENPFVFIGAAVGGALNAVNNYQAYKSGQITGAQYAQAIAVGALTGALSGFGVGLIGSTIVGSLTSAANTGITNLITASPCDSVTNGVINGAIAGGVGGATTAAGQAVGGKFTESVIGAAVKGPLKNFSTPGGIIGFAVGTMIGVAL